jgi:hypothetical protein
MTPDTSPATGPSFGTRCAQKILEAKGLGRPLGPVHLAEIIDQEFAMIQPDFTLSPTTGKKERNGSDIPPTPVQVESYSRKIGWPLDGSAFCDHYEAKGWRLGGEKMKNWQAVIRKHKREGFSFGGPAPASAKGDPKIRGRIDRTYEHF